MKVANWLRKNWQDKSGVPPHRKQGGSGSSGLPDHWKLTIRFVFFGSFDKN
jgi:hypothetical protein